MSRPPTTAFLAMGMALTREAAQHWADAAARDGATPEQVAEALAAWDAMQADEVRVIRSQPHPVSIPCECSHSRLQHSRAEGQCGATVCGCLTYRPRKETPARFDERRDPDWPHPIDRRP